MKVTRIGLAVLTGAIVTAVLMIGYEAVVFDRNGVLSPGSGVENTEYEWRVLKLTLRSQQYKILAKFDSGYRNEFSGRVPRVKIERVIDSKVFLLCEYVKDDQHAAAQRFDPNSGLYVEELNPELFRPLSEAMQNGTSRPDQSAWSLGDRLAPTIDLASSIVSLCEGSAHAPVPVNRS